MLAKDQGSPNKPLFFVFPKWTNRLREISLGLAGVGLVYVGILTAAGFAPSTLDVGYAPEQPIPYSHRLHVGELGLDCRYCHNTVESTARAAIPPVATCMNCHATVKTESAVLEPLREAARTEGSIRWVRVHDLPDFVYFDHSAHLTAGVGCVSCHGRVDRMDVVRQEKPLSMGWCITCHRAPEAELRPRHLITDLAWQPGENAAEEGLELARLYDVTPSTVCSTCHR